MSIHPLNLAVRFLLELFILFAFGYWAWNTQVGWPRYFLVAILPIAAAVVWGIFRVPADHGKGLVAVPGIVRLLIEVVMFSAAWYCLSISGLSKSAFWFLIFSLLHYILSYDRVILLLKN